MARKPPTELKRSGNQAYVRWNGRKLYFGKWGSPKSVRDFSSWLTDQIKHPDAPGTQGRITICECTQAFLAHCKGYYPRQEYLNIESAIEDLLALNSADRAIEFGPKKLKTIQAGLAKAADKSGNLVYARSTINAKIDRIRRCFRWCASEELIPVEIFTALETVSRLGKGRGLARETEPVQPVPAAVVLMTLPFLSPTVAAMVQVQYLMGGRPQDVHRMTTGTIDQTGEIWFYRPAAHKGAHRGQSLVKAIPKAAQAILAPFLRDDPVEPLFSPLDTKKHFGNAPKKKAKRTPYSTGSYGKAIVYAIARALKQDPPVKIPRWTPNQLRHAIGTDVRESSGIEAAQAYLGHQKPDTTTIYAERTKAALEQIAASIVSPFAPSKDQSEPQ